MLVYHTLPFNTPCAFCEMRRSASAFNSRRQAEDITRATRFVYQKKIPLCRNRVRYTRAKNSNDQWGFIWHLSDVEEIYFEITVKHREVNMTFFSPSCAVTRTGFSTLFFDNSCDLWMRYKEEKVWTVCSLAIHIRWQTQVVGRQRYKRKPACKTSRRCEVQALRARSASND